MTKQPRPSRPRLEIRKNSEVAAIVADNNVIYVDTPGESRGINFTLKDARRLHQFLGKAIAYLSANGAAIKRGARSKSKGGAR